MINEERKALYEELIEKGSWHDHENNANWRAFFYLLTSDLMRYNFNEEEFFKEPKDFPYWKKWGKLEKKIPLSSGEKAMFNLAIYLYSQGQYPFSISML